MEAVGGDAYLGTKTEFATIGKLRGRVVQHDGAVDQRQKPLGRLRIGSNNAFGMPGTVFADMAHGFVQPRYHTCGDDGRQEFVAEVFCLGRHHTGIGLLANPIAAYFTASVQQSLQQRNALRRGPGCVHQQGFR